MVAKLAYTSGRRMSNCEGDEWPRFAGQRANLEENNNGTERPSDGRTAGHALRTNESHERWRTLCHVILRARKKRRDQVGWLRAAGNKDAYRHLASTRTWLLTTLEFLPGNTRCSLSLSRSSVSSSSIQT